MSCNDHDAGSLPIGDRQKELLPQIGLELGGVFDQSATEAQVSQVTSEITVVIIEIDFKDAAPAFVPPPFAKDQFPAHLKLHWG